MFPRLRRSWTDSFITPRSSPLRVPATGSKTEPQIAASKKIRPKKTRMITTVLAKKVSQIKLRPACPARRAAARLRRALVWPILTPPPVRAIQTSTPLGSKDRKRQIVLNCEGNSVYKGRNHWLVFTRPSVAGFDAPLDTIKPNFKRTNTLPCLPNDSLLRPGAGVRATTTARQNAQRVLFAGWKPVLHSHTAVDAKDLAGDVRGVVGGEESGGLGDVLDCAEGSHRDKLLYGFLDEVGQLVGHI